MTDLDDLTAELGACGEGVTVERDVPFASLSTYRLGGPVAVLARVRSRAALDAVQTVTSTARPPLLVVGRGSNLLVDDAGFAGVAVLLAGDFETVVLPGDTAAVAPGEGRDGAGGEATVRAGGAVPLPVLARRTATGGWAGLEFFVGIPGSVGGAVRMNAGGHGRETAEVLRAAQLVDLLDSSRDGTGATRSPAMLDHRYRHSNVGRSHVVVEAEMVVRRDSRAACEDRIAEVVRWRRAHQPGGSNAGSVFRNPPDDSAGRLIDVTGLKGLRVGGAVVSDKHANFFQAEAGATAADVRALVTEVIRRVEDATGARLVPELQIVGEDEGEGKEIR